MRVFALVPYRTNFCAGQKFRIELWARHLKERGIEVEFFPFADERLTEVIYSAGRTVEKGYGFARCYLEQILRVAARGRRPDLLFIYREAALIGPALIERLSRRLWRVPIIYDIDEPLFVPYVSPTNGRLNALKFFSKIDSLFQMSDMVFAVNGAIADYAKRHARDVRIVPMAVDTERYRPAEDSAVRSSAAAALIGWMGTMTTQPNLEIIAEPLRRLKETRGAQLRVIADRPMTLPGVDLDFIQWRAEVEIPRLHECQIGIVPVKPNVWNPWKFFFKTIQFMSLGLAVVATPAGSNLEIIEDGVTGFLADSDDEWHERLCALIDDPALCRRMGEAARATAVAQFGINKQIDFVESAFRAAIRASQATAEAREAMTG